MLLFGPAAELGAPPAGVEVVDAPVSIAKAEDPVAAARTTPDASIVLATQAVAEGRAQALVCAGGTGAALAAGTFNVKRDRGIYRPALAVPLPVPGNPVTLLDVGASAEARREHLVQFAFMGAALAQIVLGVARPRVGLLSNGEEDAAAARSSSRRPTRSCASWRVHDRSLRVRRQRRGRRPRQRPRRRGRDRRLHRQRRAEGAGGHLPAAAPGDPRCGELARRRASSAGCC